MPEQRSQTLRARRRLIFAAGVVCAALAAASMLATTASAHGNLDQYLAGDPGCNATNFPQSAPLDSAIRQRFVPSGTSLSSIGVCLSSSAASGTIVSLAVREGSASSPGALVGALNVTAPAGATTYVHADFPAPLNVAAGDSYVIELAPASAQIVWRGAPDGVDWYPAGESSTAIPDLAFRSYVVPEAPTATHTSTNTPAITPPAAATSTTGLGTNTPTRTPTRTPTATSTATVPATATAAPTTPTAPVPTPTLPNVSYPDTGATSTPGPAGTSVPPSSTTRVSGTAGAAATSAAPGVSVTPSGVVLAASTPQRGDVIFVSEDASDDDGGMSWGVVVMAAAAAIALAAGGAYGVWRWRTRE